MPKKTFYNLSKEKKNKLVEAGLKEFSRVDLNSASISNIIKYASIPRGSFYQYFYDKKDMFTYLLLEYCGDIQLVLINKIKEHEGDIFKGFIETFKNLYSKICKDEVTEFFKNSFLHMDNIIQNKLTEKIQEKENEIIGYMNLEKMRFKDNERLKYLIRMIIAITIQNIITSFSKELTIDESIKIYIIEMDLLMNGTYIVLS